MGNFSVGLALGGGGVRGLSHLGVIQALHKENIMISHISGTSIGSLLGAMYAYSQDPDWIKNRFLSFSKNKNLISSFEEQFGKINNESETMLFDYYLFKVKENHFLNNQVKPEYLIPKKFLKEIINYMLPINSFEDLAIPLFVSVSDINNNEEIIYEKGDLIEAVVQSSSVPGYFEPTLKGDKVLVDGGVINPIPISLINNHCKFVIAVDVSNKNMPLLRNKSMLDISKRAENTSKLYLSKALGHKADILIEPDGFGLHWAEMGMFEDLVESGFESLMSKIDNINIKLERN